MSARLGHCTPTLGGHSPACDRDGTYCSQASSHAGPCTPHGRRAEPCADCGHRAHRSGKYGGGGCNGIIDSGWTWHGCHCTTGPDTEGEDR